MNNLKQSKEKMTPQFFCFFLSLAIFLSLQSSATIFLGDTLYASTPNQSWSSPNSTFSISFIATGSNSYIASITYSGGVPIWTVGSTVDSGGALQLLPNGALRLTNGSGANLWDSGTANRGVSYASLEDSGELRLLNNANLTVWSSFDNPTDTILPLQNFTIGKVLQSGLYSFSFLRSGNLTLRWNETVVYWNKGLNLSLHANLTTARLVLHPIGILSVFDPSLTNREIVAYSSDYAEGSDILRFLRLDNDGNLRIYSSVRGSGTITMRWAAVSDQCQVFGYCGNLGICGYNGSNPSCECPSEDFEHVDLNDRRKGCRRKVEIEDCPGNNTTMRPLDHSMFLTYPPESLSQAFFLGMSSCRLNCLVSRSCVASTSLVDGSGLCYLKTSSFVSGYQVPVIPSTSYIKVCGSQA
ncbi:G-type lectin S-receptor-like serine/threonine-protein kinase At1g34300 [Durio zibethinus]|uniref:non-specific serine/threonine protein kinase n=1 Tax=Durio zibethinus TaxID=66656 RepID=A0A6P5XJ63_DURZI|nr:G-type lectin S-receptor-like serine/threonine-protein kinase At1g34300 [Durio zibethinus]